MICKNCFFKSALLSTMKAFSLLLAAALLTAGCGAAPTPDSTATAENTDREMQSHEQTEDTAVVQQAALPEELPVVCPFCEREDVEKGQSSYETQTLEAQICPYDQFAFATEVVLVQTDCTCRQCGQTWVQQERYTLSSCPAHGSLVEEYESATQPAGA